MRCAHQEGLSGEDVVRCANEAVYFGYIFADGEYGNGGAYFVGLCKKHKNSDLMSDPLLQER